MQRTELEQKVLALVNPFGNKESDSPDNFKKIDSVDDQILQVLNEYENITRYAKNTQPSTLHANNLIDELILEKASRYAGHKIEKLCVPVLLPSQINLVLQRIISEKKTEMWTQRFVSKLIQLSYVNLGYDSFVLDVRDARMQEAGTYLVAQKEKPITLTVEGGAGRWCACFSKNAVYNFKGDLGYGFAYKSENCIFNLEGKVAEHPGFDSKACLFRVSLRETYNQLKMIIPESQGAVEYIGK